MVMVYIETKERNRKKYYYLAESVREGKKIKKHRKYLGCNLSKQQLQSTIDKEKREKKIRKSIAKIKPVIIKVLKRYNVKKAGIFGSYARGEQSKQSDIDILVEPPEGMGFEFAGLEIKLEDALKRKVDLVSYNGISPYLKDRILKEEIRIL